LLDGAKDNPEVAGKFLRTIDRNSERLKLLIEDLLTISELESGRMKMNLQPVALRPLIDKIFADLKARAESKRVTLIDDAPDLKVHADPNRLEQVLGNLVDNAIKYGREAGRVSVAAQSIDNGQAEILVQDDGPGIPAEALERVFERFYRIDKARSREQGGTGLGLSIVKHIVQSHGGRVWARSESGKGAGFYFTLPLDPESGQQPLL
jgi:two-component system phosphate regulon sensor histidine kinase PhoR